MLAKSPNVTLYTGGSDGFVSSTASPIASGWSEPSSRAGLSPAVDQRLFTAHAQSRFTPISKTNENVQDQKDAADHRGTHCSKRICRAHCKAEEEQAAGCTSRKEWFSPDRRTLRAIRPLA